MNYNNKNMLVGALLVAGFDKHNGGQVRYVHWLHHSSSSSKQERRAAWPQAQIVLHSYNLLLTLVHQWLLMKI
jgi:hypothetical protein